MRLPRLLTVLALSLYASLAWAAPPTAEQKRQAEVHLRLAKQYLESNQPRSAEREFEAAIALDASNADAHYNLGTLQYFRGDYRTALAHLSLAVKLRPALPARQRALLGMCQRRAGQPEEARAELGRDFVQLDDKRLSKQVGLELIELDLGANEMEKAGEVAGQLRLALPDDVEVQFTAHRIYSLLADESMLDVGLLAPRSARMHLLIAQELSRQGDLEGAVAHYREALKLDPSIPGVHFEMAELLASSPAASDQEETLAEYKAAIAANPFDDKAECRLGEIAARANENAEAKAHFERALELQPGNIDANLGLAKLLAADRQHAQALPYLQRAARLDPFDAVVRYNLASVYRNLGRGAEARKELEEVRRLKEMKAQMKQVYHDMRVRPSKRESTDETPEP